MTLFLMNAIAGRVWCGYSLPADWCGPISTKSSDGNLSNRRERMQRDAGPMDLEKFSRSRNIHFGYSSLGGQAAMVFFILLMHPRSCMILSRFKPIWSHMSRS